MPLEDVAAFDTQLEGMLHMVQAQSSDACVISLLCGVTRVSLG